MSKLLDARQLSRSFGDLAAVKDVSFTLDRQEVLGFLGLNGAGKSTCLRMLTGSLRPDGGAVHLDGIDLWRWPQAAKQHLGYLPETPPLYRDQRVDEYLDFCAHLHRVPRKAVVEARERTKRHCGLEAVGRRLIGKLSKGYQQRVGIAQALVHDPQLIVLDEPTVGLDPAQIREIRGLIRELGETRAVLLSSHLLAEIHSVCSRVLILHQGQIVHSATLSQADPLGLILELQQPPKPDALQALQGVAEVEPLHTTRFRLQLAPAGSPAEIARQVVEAGWGLLQLTPDDNDLERIFMDLTRGRDAA